MPACASRRVIPRGNVDILIRCVTSTYLIRMVTCTTKAFRARESFSGHYVLSIKDMK